MALCAATADVLLVLLIVQLPIGTRAGGFRQQDEGRYLETFGNLTAASYETPLPSGLSIACRARGRLPGPLQDCRLPAGNVSAAAAQAACGNATCRCVVGAGTTLVMDGSLVVPAMVVEGALHWSASDESPGVDSAAHGYRWLCAGYVIATDNGAIRIRAGDGQRAGAGAAIVYIMDNGAQHAVAGKRVIGAVYTTRSRPGMPALEVVGRALARTWSLLAQPLSAGQVWPPRRTAKRPF